MASTFMFLVTFLMIFVAIMGVYGVGSGIPQISNTINQITGPSPVIGTASCSFSSEGPTAGCNLLDTALLGGTWLLAAIGSLLFRIGGIFYLIYQLVSIVGLLTAIPVLGPAFVAIFTIFFAFYAWSHLRASHSPD